MDLAVAGGTFRGGLVMIDLDEDNFDSLVDKLVSEMVSSSKVSSFPKLLRLLPGIPPPDTVASLNRLRASFPSADVLLKDAERGARGSVRQSQHERVLGIPHPLDYDWRFERQTAESLLRTAVELSGAPRSVVMIGTPTVAIAALANAKLKQVVLLDANSRIVHQLASMSPKINALCVDVRWQALPALSAPVVITDAPWYADSMSAFLWASSQLCEIGGYVMASFPSIGTRPGIVEERKSLIALGAENGLNYLEMKTGAVRYETPPFERSAFRACGITNVPANWRRADLLLFQRTSRDAGSRPARAEAEPEWVDVEIHDIRLKVRGPLAFEFDDPRLGPIISGNVLPSVSRRDPRRRNAEIWTSTNRIFSCRGRSVFVQIGRAIASDEQPAEAVTRWLRRDLTKAEQAIVQKASEQLRSLVQQELADLRSVE
jgi:hypothetical protein